MGATTSVISSGSCWEVGDPSRPVLLRRSSSASSVQSWASSVSGECVFISPTRHKLFHLVPPKEWNGHVKGLGVSARNNLPWDGKRPVPKAPKGCRSWLLPASDKLSERIAKLEDSLRDAGWKIATSKPHVIKRLGHKAGLRDYAAQIGLLALMPAHYTSAYTARYPCILKPSVGEFGKQTLIVRCVDDVLRNVPDGNIGSAWVLQELIVGSTEMAVSLLVQGGTILEAIGTAYSYSKDVYVWPNVDELGRDPFDVDEAHVQCMSMFLSEYTGICNFNYKVRADGRICVFEINTRIGSDLACDVPRGVARQLFLRLDESFP